MRLIDADRLKAHYCWWSGGSKEMTIDEAKKIFDTIIDVQPTVDAVPTEFHDKCMEIEIEKRFELELKEKHGHWEYLYEENYKCSECGDWWVFIEGTPKDNGADYCPHCGAKMDEVEDVDIS